MKVCNKIEMNIFDFILVDEFKDFILNVPGVIGVGGGFKIKGGKIEYEKCISINVEKKLSIKELKKRGIYKFPSTVGEFPEEIVCDIPPKVGGFPVDVVDVGEIKAK